MTRFQSQLTRLQPARYFPSSSFCHSATKRPPGSNHAELNCRLTSDCIATQPHERNTATARTFLDHLCELSSFAPALTPSAPRCGPSALSRFHATLARCSSQLSRLHHSTVRKRNAGNATQIGKFETTYQTCLCHILPSSFAAIIVVVASPRARPLRIPFASPPSPAKRPASLSNPVNPGTEITPLTENAIVSRGRRCSSVCFANP